MAHTDSWGGNNAASDARRTAEEAARRAGMPLADWLDSVMTEERAAVEEIDDRAADRRAQRSTIDERGRGRDWSTLRERTESLRRSVARQEPPRETRRQPAQRPVAREKFAAEETATRRRWRDRDSNDHVESDVAAEPEPAKAPDAVSNRREDDRAALAAIDERLAQLEKSVGTRGGDGPDPIKPLIAQIDARINTLAARTERDRGADEALQSLGSRIARLTEMVDKLGQSGAPNAQVQRLEAKLNTIVESLDRAVPAKAASAPAPKHAAGSRGLNSIEEAVAGIARRQRELAAAEPTPAKTNPAARPAQPMPSFDFKSFDRRLETIADRIERAADIATAPIRAETRAMAGLKDDINRLASRLDRDPPAPRIDLSAIERLPVFEQLHGEIARISTRLDAEAHGRSAPDDRMAFDTSAVADLKKDINRLASRLDRDPPAPRIDLSAIEKLPVFEHLQAEIGRISARLDAEANGRPAPEDRIFDTNAVADLKQDIGRLASRLDRPPPPPPRIDLSGIEKLPVFGHLQGEIARLSERLDSQAGHRSKAEDQAFATLRNDIQKLTARVEDARQPAPHPDLVLLRREVGDLSQALAKLASRQSVTAIENAVRDLSERIEVSREDGIRESLLQPVENFTKELRDALKTLDPRLTIEALDQEIRGIGKTLDAMAGRGFDPDAFARIHDQTQEIRDLLSAAAQRPLPLERMEQQIAALNTRLDDIARQASAERLANPAATAADIRAMLTGVLPADALGALERRVEALSDKLDETLSRPAVAEDSIAALSQNIDRVQKTISSQLASVTDTRPLETMVRRLAENVETLRQPDVDLSMLEGLESQIARIAARLDRADANAATAGSLQQSIGDLFQKLETARLSTVEAAETAARAAAHEALRDTMAASAAAGPQVATITRELADLRSMQDDADQRTHSTLLSVHETLEKIVDRLSSLEREGPPAPRPAPPAASLDEILPRGAAAPARRGSDPRPASRAPLDLGAAGRQAPAEAADPSEFLIEPGSGYAPRRGDQSKSRAPQKAPQAKTPAAGAAADEQPAQSAFIAAARRAAQAAAAEAGNTRVRPVTPGDGEPRAIGANPIDRMRAFLKDRKRPLLLALAGVVILLGAYEIMRGIVPRGDLEAERAPIEIPAQPRPEPAKTRSPQAMADPAMPSRQAMADLNAPASGFDYTPVGSVGPTSSTFARLSALPGPAARGTEAKARVVTASALPDPTRGIAPLPLLETAQAGDSGAQFELGMRLVDGRGMPRDLKQASGWFQKAAAKGLAPAQYRLGIAYEKGLGVDQDLVLAKTWYQRAAEAGNAHAMHNLAVVLAAGGGGKADYGNAANWFRKAANLGIRDSQYNLGILYARGLGMEADMAQSYIWFALAAGQGDEDAGHKRDLVAKRLGKDDLAAANASVEAFHAAPLDAQANEVVPPTGGWLAAPPRISAREPKISML